MASHCDQLIEQTFANCSIVYTNRSTQIRHKDNVKPPLTSCSMTNISGGATKATGDGNSGRQWATMGNNGQLWATSGHKSKIMRTSILFMLCARLSSRSVSDFKTRDTNCKAVNRDESVSLWKECSDRRSGIGTKVGQSAHVYTAPQHTSSVRQDCAGLCQAH